METSELLLKENAEFLKYYKEELSDKNKIKLIEAFCSEYAISESSFYYRLKKTGFSPSMKKFICTYLHANPETLFPNQNVKITNQ